ncbi:MAG: response regulator transcription factor [Sphingobacteriaceae bacterium]|nr:response regulator transcription factor [Sphingobacteriaceae bacterium]
MPNNIKKIWIADDHQLVIDGIKLLLQQKNNIKVIGESNNGNDLLQAIKENAIDLIISDLKMPGINGFTLMAIIKENYPEIPLLVISMSDELEMIFKLFQTEVEGYILKNSGKEELFNAIDNILEGKVHYEKKLMQQILEKQRVKTNQTEIKNTNLSSREIEVLKLIVNEKTSKEIAELLFIGKQTVDFHRQNIYEKTGTKTLAGLIKFAINNQIA